MVGWLRLKETGAQKASDEASLMCVMMVLLSCSFSFLDGSLLPTAYSTPREGLINGYTSARLDWKRILFSAGFLSLVGSRKMGETRIFLSIQLFSLYYLLKLYRANRGRINEMRRGRAMGGKVRRTAYNKLKLTKNVKLFFLVGWDVFSGTMAAIQIGSKMNRPIFPSGIEMFARSGTGPSKSGTPRPGHGLSHEH